MLRALPAIAVGVLIWILPALAQKTAEPGVVALMELSRKHALDYTHSLPDFVCTEKIRRYAYSNTGRQFGWKAKDLLTVKLSFFQQKEDHKLLTINGQPTDRDYLTLEGATGAGEFGGILQSIYNTASHAVFQGQSWKRVRHRRVAVVSYSVDLANSRYLLVTGLRSNPTKVVVGFHGELEVDSTTGEIVHLTYLADHIPPVAKLDKVATTVDYEPAVVGGRSYLLPSHSDTVMQGAISARNEIDFTDYRKFSTDSTIDFGPAK